jgi:hypothetical protein
LVHIQEEGSLADIIVAAETGFPTVAVETEENGDSRSTTYERGPLLVGFWACRVSTRELCSTLTALVGPVQNIFFPRRTLFQFLCTHRPASWAGSRAGSPVSVHNCGHVQM